MISNSAIKEPQYNTPVYFMCIVIIKNIQNEYHARDIHSILDLQIKNKLKESENRLTRHYFIAIYQIKAMRNMIRIKGARKSRY
jgi:low affinity Fe/Cu permease